MKKILIILSLLLLGEYSFSQQYLNKTFVIDGQNKIQTILPTDSGYILALWYSKAICLIDSQANIMWLKTFYQSGWASYTGCISPNALINTNHNTYIAGGIMQNGGPSANKVFSVKYSSTFDTLYLKLLLQDTVTTNNVIFNSFINTNGNYVFVGQSGYSGMIIQTDTNSNFIDSTLILKGTDASWFNTGLQVGNYYYFFGSTRSYAPLQVTGFDRLDGWVVKTDLQGNEITSVAFGNPILYDYEFRFVIKRNNFLVTAISSGNIKHTSGAVYLSPKILILDENLNISNEVKLNESFLIGDTMYRSYINQIVADSKNNLFLLMWDNKFNVNAYTNRNTTSVVKLDSLYNICYYRNYTHLGGQFNSEIPVTMNTTSDGGYIFGGYVNDNTLTPPQQAWLVKTDSLGCDGFTSCNDTALAVQILNFPDTLCQNDTNFVDVRLKGRSAPYSLYANSTMVLDSIYYPYTLPLWIDTTIMVFPTDTGWQPLIITLHESWERTASDTVQVYVVHCPTTYASQDFYKRKVEIFPNPATTELHVNIKTAITSDVTITIYNTQGKAIKQILTKQSENVIDVSGLQQGVYWVKVNGNELICNEKFVKL